MASKSKELNAWFGATQALYDVAMHVPANHATAIIGPSGCGKSTFVRCLNRMHETVRDARLEGRVRIGSMEVYGNGTSAVEVRRRVGMVFQKPNPFPTMSIYDNVAAGLKLNGFHNRRVLDEVVERSLHMAALWDEVKDSLKKKSGASLSGGQQQRLCIARALAVQPEVMLMDEPASALDPISTSKIEELIFQLKEQYTIVIVTHNMQQAARVAEYTGFFLMGKLIEFDKTEKIFTNPVRQADGRLHHRQVRIVRTRFHQGLDQLKAEAAHHGRHGRAGRGARRRGLPAAGRRSCAGWCSRANPPSTSWSARSTSWRSTCSPCSSPWPSTCASSPRS